MKAAISASKPNAPTPTPMPIPIPVPMEVPPLCGAAAAVTAEVAEVDEVDATMVGFAEEAKDVELMLLGEAIEEVDDDGDDDDEVIEAANIYPFIGIALAKPAEAIVVVANT
jgi:hypothetical protein